VALAALLAALTLTSPAFADGGRMPARLTCDGKDISPPLRWTAPPRGTRDLRLTLFDPDAPGAGFTHWRARVPAAWRALREGQHAPVESVNDFGRRGYSGPCPPPGPAHRYAFTLRAVDARGKTLATARLVGRYARRTTQAAASARTARVWDDQLASNLTDAQLRFVATHVDGSQKLPRSQVDALHRLNPRFRVLQYRLAIGLGRRTQILDGDRWVPEWPARPLERWFAHVNGRRELMKRWGWYLTNPDDASWKRTFTTQLRGQIARTHTDAALLDSASPPTYFGGSAWSPPLHDLDPPFERAWSRRLERWLPYVQRTIGKPVIANAGSLVTTRDTTDYSRIAGVMIEGFGHGLAPGDWLLQMRRAQALTARGRIVICQSYPSNARERLFDVASALLIVGPHTYVNLQTSTQPEWWAEYDLPLGRPLGPAGLTTSGLSSRSYEGGIVYVNASSTSVTQNYFRAVTQLVPRGGGLVSAAGTVPASVDRREIGGFTLEPGDAIVIAQESG
jgi:Raf kinase inhibitor-like YbhB/YbcL family protein